MKTFFIETYGCQMNVSDSEAISGILASAGYLSVDDIENADLIIVNTCAVRDTAVSKVKAQICRFKPLRNRKKIKIAVAGCLAEHEGESLLKDLPIDYVIGPDRYKFLSELEGGVRVSVSSTDDENGFYSGFSPVRKKGVNTWVQVMRGCDNFCSYCVVPYVRGRERSKPSKDIIREIEGVVSEGFPEVTLLGQNVNSYKDGDLRFHDLLRHIDKIKGLKRVRFMTSHPKDLSDDLINCFGELSTLCEYLHLPVQSGSDKILAAMNRGYTNKDYRLLIDKIRKRVPSIALSTDILSGFPGESDEDHALTLQLVKDIGYDAGFMFIYSKRKGTKAASMEEQLKREIKVARVNEIINVQMEITKAKNSQCIGNIEEVIVEGVSPRNPSKITARTRTFKNVILDGTASEVGSFLTVRVTGSTGWALEGEREGV
ncbi:MAG: tRNA (N6-isopentenyl adenosine(37)-C2)-methylthiotransferase MiaB [Fibrobacteres bacterium]|nr:tRNA (N6-isopentenyl adenosine(37)-C2)-methylthiotransferase MiaB [Fibrobacterota bacterium]